MGEPVLTRTILDDEDTQGLLRFGYGALIEACYLLLRIRDIGAARTWLEGAQVASAARCATAPDTAMQIAFTADGLAALDVPHEVIGAFSHEFVSGMTEPSRLRRLGDVGPDAPAQWLWGGTAASMPHVLVMLFAKPERLDGFLTSVTGDPLCRQAFDNLAQLDTSDLHGREPFGFVDGISQPLVEWSQRGQAATSRIGYGNHVALGEFVLGYPNEYGRYTERPLLDPSPATHDLPQALDAPRRKDLGRNGTYLVMRQLDQHVRTFWRFMWQHADGDAPRAHQLAAAAVGRTLNGDPLVDGAIGSTQASSPQNDFTFDADPVGTRCPIGAHIRRANPRNADYVGHPSCIGRVLASVGLGPNGFRDDLTSSVRFHRVLRRGREYGPGLTPEQALSEAPPDDPKRGLHFICLNANISRQFEFVQNAWTMNGRFSGLPGENDPIIGNRNGGATTLPGGAFTLPDPDHLRRRVAGMPQFVTLRGGAYFFLPGLRALRYLALAGCA